MFLLQSSIQRTRNNRKQFGPTGPDLVALGRCCGRYANQKMKKDPYVTFIGAKGVVFSWIGAVVGPLFFIVGLTTISWVHSLIGAGMLIVVAVSIRDGLCARKAGINSDFVALTIVPFVLLLGGVGVAYAAHKGYI
jgi:hypothetical protein